MLRDVLIGQYYPGDSAVHRLDARTKLIAVAVYVTVLFLAQSWPGYAVATLFLAVAVAAARVPPRLVLRSLRPVLLLILLTVALHAVLTAPEGRVLLSLGPVRITAEGLDTGLRNGLRIGLLILMSSVLTLTTSPIELADAIERLTRPLQRFGFPAHELAMMMTIALRFIPTLLEEADRIMKAQMARGADLGRGSLAARVRALVPILVPLFVSAFRRADDLALAMESRCYQGGAGRTRYRVSRLGGRDAVALALTAVFVVAMLGIGRA